MSSEPAALTSFWALVTGTLTLAGASGVAGPRLDRLGCAGFGGAHVFRGWRHL